MIDNIEYMQIEYIDYELSENDSIYEVSDKEFENEEENIYKDNDEYMQIEYVDYELRENDIIYEVSDIETENEEENIDLNNDVMTEEI